MRQISEFMKAYFASKLHGENKQKKYASNFLGKTESVSVIGGGEVVNNSASLKNKTNKIDQDEQIRYIINK